MKKILCLMLALLMAATCMGCLNKDTLQQTEPGNSLSSTPEGSGGTEPTNPEKTEPSESTKPTGGTEVTEPTTEPADRYENGDPYTPFGEQVTFNFKAEGNAVTFSANAPKMQYTEQTRDVTWVGKTEKGDMELLVAYVAADTCDINSLKTFFKDAAPRVLEDCKSYYAYDEGHDTKIRTMAPTVVDYDGISLCKAIGSISYKTYENKSVSFIGYAMQTENGGYLYWLTICKGTDWSGTKDLAENFGKTIREGIS